MTSLFLFLLSSLLVSACSGLPPDHHQSRIVGGTSATYGEFPFVVQYVDRNGLPLCGASIINDNWVMTAAHCAAHYQEQNMYIRPGTIIASDETAPMIKVNESVIHENFTTMIENDIALLKLEQPLIFGPRIQPALLPQPFQETAAGTRATVVGWGHTSDNYEPARILMKAEIEVFSDEACQEAYSGYPYPLWPSNICAGLPEGGRGQCNGDSGGPLIANGYQVGIVSWSRKPCSSKGSPGVFTEVSYYIDWIKEKTSN